MAAILAALRATYNDKLCLSSSAPFSQGNPTMLFELRRYEIRAGRRAEWVEFFESVIAPFQVAKGVVIAGMFTSETEADVFMWLRRFDDEAARVRLYAAIYEDPVWLSEVKPRIDELLNRETVQITRLHPTPHSVLR
jgi:hypothetical protein